MKNQNEIEKLKEKLEISHNNFTDLFESFKEEKEKWNNSFEKGKASNQKDVLKILEEYKINKFLELHKVQQLLAMDYSEEELLELFKDELKNKIEQK